MGTPYAYLCDWFKTLRERVVLKYNLNGEDYVVSYILDEFQTQMVDKGMYNEIDRMMFREMIDKVATHIVEEVGITWVEELDWQYQERLRRGRIGKDENRYPTTRY